MTEQNKRLDADEVLIEVTSTKKQQLIEKDDFLNNKEQLLPLLNNGKLKTPDHAIIMFLEDRTQFKSGDFAFYPKGIFLEFNKDFIDGEKEGILEILTTPIYDPKDKMPKAKVPNIKIPVPNVEKKDEQVKNKQDENDILRKQIDEICIKTRISFKGGNEKLNSNVERILREHPQKVLEEIKAFANSKNQRHTAQFKGIPSPLILLKARKEINERQKAFNTEKEPTPEVLSEIKKKEIENQKIINPQESISQDTEELKEKSKHILQITLPHTGKTISEFCYEVSSVLLNKNHLFHKTDTGHIVEVVDKVINRAKIKAFESVTPPRFVTLIEKYCQLGVYIENRGKNKDESEAKYIYQEKSLGTQIAIIVLASDILKKNLPKINRIFQFPRPIIFEGKLTLPKVGYDERFSSWLDEDSPRIDPNMSLEDAKKVLDFIFAEFCFEHRDTEEDKEKGIYNKTNAIIALLTPFIRGLYSRWTIRTPLMFYLGNRPRVGKDTLANITGIAMEGQIVQDMRIGTGSTSEEIRKNIFSDALIGRTRKHFANCSGYLNFGDLEASITKEIIAERLLGGNELIKIPNETDYSASGNTGIRYSEDLKERCKFVKLFYDGENANSRTFNTPHLEGWALKNRSKILSALFALVKNWYEKGMPNGKEIFTSFPEWAEICGGIMECAGYKNQCHPDKDLTITGGDDETDQIKSLFEYCYERGLRNIPISKQEIREIINHSLKTNEELMDFSYYDFSKKGDQTAFGNHINKYLNREFNGIYMIADNLQARPSRQKLIFTKDPKGYRKGSPVDKDDPIPRPFPENGKPQIENIDLRLKQYPKSGQAHFSS